MDRPSVRHNRQSPILPPAISMFTSDQAARLSTDKFIRIFSIASDEYNRLTGQDLRKHPLATDLDTCRNPQDVSKLLQAHAQAFSKFSEGDKKLMKWLDPTPFSPAKAIFTGIGVLLGAVRDDAASHESLIQLFERIRYFLQRLERYIRNLFTDELSELLGKIMAQLLSILARSTKAMTDGRISELTDSKRREETLGRDDIENELSRLDTLTKEEIWWWLQRAWNHRGTARWFIEGSTFREWKKSGAGKSVLCSAIIEDIKNMRKATSTSMAYYYFDYKDASKRDIRGLLASLLFHSVTILTVVGMLYMNCSKVPRRLRTAQRSRASNCLKKSDIQAVLDPLTSTSYRISLHEESGQREDINSYVESFVRKDRAMRKWREEDRVLVISSLSERGGGMFRWVVCQLDTLRQCFPSSIRKTLDELPASLDETYERTLQGIPKEKRHHAHRLFQCLIAAVGPLRVEELAEENWRPENPEEAVLSACSTLISVIEYEGSKIVQFSHFSVKEFLTSDRIRSSEDTNIRHYYSPLDSAHTILARACLAVLLQLDDSVLRGGALGKSRQVRGVASRVEGAVEQLFDPSKSHLAAWIWIHDIDRHGNRRSIGISQNTPPSPDGTALYYAAFCGLSELTKHLIIAHTEDVNTIVAVMEPIACAVYMGHLDAAPHRLRDLEVMRLLLEHGANVDVQYDDLGSISHDASFEGNAEIIQVLLQHKADVNARGTDKASPRHCTGIVYRTLDGCRASPGTQCGCQRTDRYPSHPLHFASSRGYLEFVRVLLRHGADVHIREERDLTPFQMAKARGMMQLCSCC
ncbi:hypothetical protein BC826DRAFT_1168203 [Russula brevipes]|nr:hypothetical protein BC826DRAFT_1168203 [Russula brevipes]